MVPSASHGFLGSDPLLVLFFSFYFVFLLICNVKLLIFFRNKKESCLQVCCYGKGLSCCCDSFKNYSVRKGEFSRLELDLCFFFSLSHANTKICSTDLFMGVPSFSKKNRVVVQSLRKRTIITSAKTSCYLLKGQNHIGIFFCLLCVLFLSYFLTLIWIITSLFFDRLLQVK